MEIGAKFYIKRENENDMTLSKMYMYTMSQYMILVLATYINGQ